MNDPMQTQTVVNPVIPAAAPVAPAAQAPATPVVSAPVAPAPAPAVAGQPQVAAPVASSTQEEPVNITITLPTNAYFLSGIRDFTLAMTRNMTGFTEQWAFRFQSVVDELCNNAIEHGSAPGQEIKITFSSVPNKSLEISIEDTGTGPNKYSAAQMRALLTQQKDTVQTQFLGLRGRGLATIVSEWTDELLFEDRAEGGLRIRVKKYLNSNEGSPSPADANSANIPKAN
jgi:anti-sigma regulatory factor (Ser/Thr protein kinase)